MSCCFVTPSSEPASLQCCSDDPVNAKGSLLFSDSVAQVGVRLSTPPVVLFMSETELQLSLHIPVDKNLGPYRSNLVALSLRKHLLVNKTYRCTPRTRLVQMIPQPHLVIWTQISVMSC